MADPHWHKWYKGSNLPHFDCSSRGQFITYRMADSLPRSVLEELKAKATTHAELRRISEQYLDAGRGACWLKNPDVAKIVVENLKFHAGKRYRLIEWLIMPNHIHLAYDRPTVPLKDILHSWKSYTSHEIGKVIGQGGQFWQEDYFDRYIRDEEHLFNVRCYILLNPVHAGLVNDPFDWPHSSIHDYNPGLKDSLRRWYRAWRTRFWLEE